MPILPIFGGQVQIFWSFYPQSSKIKTDELSLLFVMIFQRTENTTPPHPRPNIPLIRVKAYVYRSVRSEVIIHFIRLSSKCSLENWTFLQILSNSMPQTNLGLRRWTFMHTLPQTNLGLRHWTFVHTLSGSIPQTNHGLRC